MTATVLWSAFAMAAIFGAIAQRSHFCTMGAIADIVNMGDWSRMRMWVLAIAIAMPLVRYDARVGIPLGLNRGAEAGRTSDQQAEHSDHDTQIALRRRLHLLLSP